VELKVGDMLEAERTLLNEGVLMRATEVRWRLEKRLGEGAFSAVWSASGVDAFGRVCAVKLTSRALCLTNDRTRISFLREVSVLRRLSHPNVVSYVTSFSTRSHHCLMLEALTGGELFELVADDSNRRRMMLPSPSEAVWEGVKDPKGEGFVRRVFGELARGVGWLHTVGVVHRDIKLESERSIKLKR
jgi:tRNA (cytidine32/guanosine34-2'-O)-methyltransferase